MLDAPGLVMPDRLEMRARIGRDPDIDIGRRDGERADSGERRGIGDASAPAIDISETLAGPAAADAQLGRGTVPEAPTGRRGRSRIVEDHPRHDGCSRCADGQTRSALPESIANGPVQFRTGPRFFAMPCGLIAQRLARATICVGLTKRSAIRSQTSVVTM